MGIWRNYLLGMHKSVLEIEAEKARPKINLVISAVGNVSDNPLYNSVYGENDKKFAEANAIDPPKKFFEKAFFNLGYSIGKNFR